LTDLDLTVLDDEHLISATLAAQEGSRQADQDLYNCNTEWERRFHEAGATIIPGSTSNVVLKPTHDYRREDLIPLLELVPHEALERGYIPAHQETVEIGAKFNMQQVKTWAKYGDRVARIIEQARFVKRTKVVIEERR
jgi:hypothetical protein